MNANISHIYLVFDGIRVPLKAGTNAERERKRKANLMEARRLVRMGRRGEASDKYRACVKGNEIMARVVAGAVERRWGSENGSRVKCIWSPYEADSQMVKLCVDGLAHAVVTEVRFFVLVYLNALSCGMNMLGFQVYRRTEQVKFSQPEYLICHDLRTGFRCTSLLGSNTSSIPHHLQIRSEGWIV